MNFGRQSRGFRFLLVLGQRPQVNDGQRQPQRRRHNLHRLAVDYVEYGSQRLVPSNDLVDAAFKNGRIHWNVEWHCQRKIVKGISRVELVQEPKTPLRERQRQPESFRGRVPPGNNVRRRNADVFALDQ